MTKDQIQQIALQSGQDAYDVAQGNVHTLFAMLILQAAQVADLISENQGVEEAHHFAHHLLQGADQLHQSTEDDLPQFEEEASPNSLEDVLRAIIARGPRQG